MTDPAMPPRDLKTQSEMATLRAEENKEDRDGYCLFLGEHISEGSNICWQGKKFKCLSGQWKDTGESC